MYSSFVKKVDFSHTTVKLTSVGMHELIRIINKYVLVLNYPMWSSSFWPIVNFCSSVPMFALVLGIIIGIFTLSSPSGADLTATRQFANRKFISHTNFLCRMNCPSSCQSLYSCLLFYNFVSTNGNYAILICVYQLCQRSELYVLVSFYRTCVFSISNRNPGRDHGVFRVSKFNTILRP